MDTLDKYLNEIVIQNITGAIKKTNKLEKRVKKLEKALKHVESKTWRSIGVSYAEGVKMKNIDKYLNEEQKNMNEMKSDNIHTRIKILEKKVSKLEKQIEEVDARNWRY